MKKNFIKGVYIAFVLFLGGLWTGTPCFSKEIKKVAVLPFVMNTQQDLTFLQKGIFDMFSSRITYGDEVAVLTREILKEKLGTIDPSLTSDINESKAMKLGALLNVDHVLFGSLTLFGNSMSLDVSMVDIKTDMPILTFFRQGNEAGAVIPELDKIAKEINFKVFGRETIEFQSQQALARAYAGEEERYASPLKKFQTLLSVNGTMNGVAIGDLDGDKKNEVVTIHDRTIQIFKYAFDGKLNLVHKIEDDSVAMTLVSVDVADINRNGVSEIFITRINNRDQAVASQVIEYDGSKYVIKKATYPWYFNVVKDAAGNPELFAQVHTEKGPWYPREVFRVEAGNESYIPGAQLMVPQKRGFSILSLVSGSIFNKDMPMYLYTDEQGRLVAFNDAGTIGWESEKGYGGSSLFYDIPATNRNATYTNEYIFLQPKSLVYDLKSDGTSKLLVIRNTEATNYLLKNTRMFREGTVEILQWNEIGMSSEDAPKKLPGPATCIAIGDYDNDSKMELLVTVISKGSSILSTDRKSSLISYNLD